MVNGFFSIYIYLSIHISIYIYISIYTSTAFTHSTLRFATKRFLCMWVSPYIHSYTHIYMYAYTHVYVRLQLPLTRRFGLARRDACTRGLAHNHIYIYIYTYKHAYMCTHISLSIYVCQYLYLAVHSLDVAICGSKRFIIYIYREKMDFSLYISIYQSIYLSIHISIYTSTAFTHSTFRFGSKRFLYTWVGP